jgi:hypothetical protein
VEVEQQLQRAGAVRGAAGAPRGGSGQRVVGGCSLHGMHGMLGAALCSHSHKRH